MLVVEERELLDAIPKLIVDRFQPERLILFGSRARGDAKPESDFDLLIIAPSDLPAWRRTPPVYLALMGLGTPKDILWFTPAEVADWKDERNHVIGRVLSEGVVLFYQE